MTGQASDRTDWQQHIRTKRGREELAKRFKDPNDPLKAIFRARVSGAGGALCLNPRSGRPAP